MYKVVSTDPVTKEEFIHWYNTSEEAENASFALHMHPMFKRKTNFNYYPKTYIRYESGK